MASRRGRLTTFLLPLYTPEEYQLLLDLDEGDEALFDTYEKYMANIDQLQKNYEAKGSAVRRLNMDVVTIMLWCRDRGLKFDGPARLRYMDFAALEDTKP